MNARDAANFLKIDIATVRKLLIKGILSGEKRIVVREFKTVAWEVNRESVEQYKNNHLRSKWRPNKQE
jgi:hypothetical protein